MTPETQADLLAKANSYAHRDAAGPANHAAFVASMDDDELAEYVEYCERTEAVPS